MSRARKWMNKWSHRMDTRVLDDVDEDNENNNG